MDAIFWFSPPVLFFLFLGLGWMILRISQRFSARGDQNPAKFLHYACGEDIDSPPLRLRYHAFFRLALLFGILHIVALMITTIPSVIQTHVYAVLYISAAALSMLILLERN